MTTYGSIGVQFVEGPTPASSSWCTGETIGETTLLDPSAASATVTAVDFSQVWFIDSKSLESYINEYPRAAAWLLIGVGKTIGRRLRTVNDKIASFYGG